MSWYTDLEGALKDVIESAARGAGARIVEAGVRDVWYTEEAPTKGYGRKELPAVQVSVSPETATTVHAAHTTGRVEQLVPFAVIVLVDGERTAPVRALALDILAAIEGPLNQRRKTSYGDLGVNVRVNDEMRTGLRIWPEDGERIIGLGDIRGTIKRLEDL